MSKLDKLSDEELRDVIWEINAAIKISDAKIVALKSDAREREEQNNLLKRYLTACQGEMDSREEK